MIVIFMFSAQNGGTSGNLSEGITYNIAKIFVDDFENMTFVQQKNLVEEMHFYIRKIAHFSIYALLGFLACINSRFYITKKKKALAVSLVFCLLYAVSDEIHQLFSDGRCGSPVDVMIDFSGSCVGTAVASVILAFITKYCNKKKAYDK